LSEILYTETTRDGICRLLLLIVIAIVMIEVEEKETRG
jgi:hypothetical protein